jgi:DNA-binding transcriptional LysR family regulator
VESGAFFWEATLKFQYIRYYLAIFEERSFIRAGRRCGVAQPSVTNAIKRLESEVGGTLFVRARSPRVETLPTDLALVMKSHLEQAFASVEHAIAVKSKSVARPEREKLVTHHHHWEVDHGKGRHDHIGCSQ